MLANLAFDFDRIRCQGECRLRVGKGNAPTSAYQRELVQIYKTIRNQYKYSLQDVLCLLQRLKSTNAYTRTSSLVNV